MALRWAFAVDKSHPRVRAALSRSSLDPDRAGLVAAAENLAHALTPSEAQHATDVLNQLADAR